MITDTDAPDAIGKAVIGTSTCDPRSESIQAQKMGELRKRSV
jgi:hypothetical protein